MAGENTTKRNEATGNPTPLWRGAMRGVDRIFDSISARPLGIVVFAASVLLLVYLQTATHGSIRTEAVGRAQHVEHPARSSSFVTQVYVLPGDSVDAGAPLVDLSPYFIDREVARLDARVTKLLQESRLAQAKLLVEEQRWLDPNVRLGPERPSLEKPTEALFAKELELLSVRRNQLLEDRERLTITSTRAGRVITVAAPGSSVAEATSVAVVAPEYAEELVAYVPPGSTPGRIAVGSRQ